MPLQHALNQLLIFTPEPMTDMSLDNVNSSRGNWQAMHATPATIPLTRLSLYKMDTKSNASHALHALTDHVSN
jgi:hypothetical protein